MKYTQEQQDQILRKLNAGVIGKRKQHQWDRITKQTKYSKEEVIKLAKKCSTQQEFQSKYNGAWGYARKHKFVDELNLTRTIADNYDLETVKKIAKQYKTRTEFQRAKGNAAWYWAFTNGKLDEVCTHMPKFRRNLSKEDIFIISKKYKTRSEWQKDDQTSYKIAWKNDWLGELFPKK